MPVKVYDYLFLSEEYIEKELWSVYKPLVQRQCRIKFEIFLSQNRFKVNKGSRIFQFVYENNDKILGVALLINNFDIGSSCLNWICVANKFQRQGIASEILKRIESHCLENDYMWLQLYSSFISENFWKRNDFIFENEKSLKMIKELKPFTNDIVEHINKNKISIINYKNY